MEQDMQDFAVEARRFLDAHVAKALDRTAFTWGEGDDSMAYFSSLPPEEEHEHVQRARAWQRIRHENGFGWITGPAEYGGRGLTPVHDLLYDAVESEYDVADTGVLSVIGLGMIGPTILAHAQPHIKDRWLPAMYRGDAIACQLFSEPGAGSDLASVATRAVREGEDWVLNGQKVWTSVAQHSQIGLALTRTNPDAPKHRGMTAFLVPMDTPGVEVRPLRQMTGGADFNEVFLTDVRIPDDHRLGEVDGGWTVALTTLMNERATVGSEESARWPPPCPRTTSRRSCGPPGPGTTAPCAPASRNSWWTSWPPSTSTPAPCTSCAPESRRAPRCPSRS